MSDRAERVARAQAWAEGPGRGLVGHPLDEARAAAEAAGLHVKTVPPGWTTTEFGIGRVRIAVDEDDLVTGISAG